MIFPSGVHASPNAPSLLRPFVICLAVALSPPTGDTHKCATSSDWVATSERPSADRLTSLKLLRSFVIFCVVPDGKESSHICPGGAIPEARESAVSVAVNRREWPPSAHAT